jgi:hypothetical protein
LCVIARAIAFQNEIVIDTKGQPGRCCSGMFRTGLKAKERLQ